MNKIYLTIFTITILTGCNLFDSDKSEKAEALKYEIVDRIDETARKTLFKQLYAAQVRARVQAEAKYPDNNLTGDKLIKLVLVRGKFEEKLSVEFKSKIAVANKISIPEGQKILAEGIIKHWK